MHIDMCTVRLPECLCASLPMDISLDTCVRNYVYVYIYIATGIILSEYGLCLCHYECIWIKNIY